VTMYGSPELLYFQLTPVGVARVQNNQLSRLDSSDRSILMEIAKLGGTAEIDELKTAGLTNSPMILSASLRRLVDLGYITQPAAATGQVGGN
jgi:hypothetical protein